jgi:hypothetical protein
MTVPMSSTTVQRSSAASPVSGSISTSQIQTVWSGRRTIALRAFWEGQQADARGGPAMLFLSASLRRRRLDLTWFGNPPRPYKWWYGPTDCLYLVLHAVTVQFQEFC